MVVVSDSLNLHAQKWSLFTGKTLRNSCAMV